MDGKRLTLRFGARFAAACTAVWLLVPQSVAATQTDLLSYLQTHVQTAPSSGIPAYNRPKQFGGWVHQDPSSACHDTREEVLARDEDPSVPLKFSANGCTVASGSWHDPYTETDFRKATDIQIDHVVPLKAAYYAGAYAWSSARRCHYANFLANGYHLLAVSGHENMSKGDRGPEGYLPPKDHCDYVGRWLRIKAIWELTATQAEVNAVTRVLQDENCASDIRYMDSDELAGQRAQAADPIRQCANF
jgi:hypothetical protein